MILTDADIRKEVKSGRIRISGFDERKLGSNSYDLSLSPHLAVYTEETLDAKLDNNIERFEIPSSGFLLQPGELYLGSTAESTSTLHHAPFLEGKSSIGRLGISVHVTAGFGDIGFTGHWTLEITVVKPVRVYAGMPIAQVWFMMPLGVCATSYGRKKDAKYRNQTSLPMPSAMWKNFTQDEDIHSQKFDLTSHDNHSMVL